MIEFHLPTLPPSKNALRVRTRRGIARSKTYEAWLAEFGWEMKLQRVRKVTGPYRLTLQAVRPDKRRRDLDNPMKALLDAMQEAGVYEDDCLIKKLTIEMRAPVKGGKCCVVILKGE